MWLDVAGAPSQAVQFLQLRSGSRGLFAVHDLTTLAPGSRQSMSQKPPQPAQPDQPSRITTDSDILAYGDRAAPTSSEGLLARVQVGAAVYSSDGVEVAIVEDVSPNHLVLRAGSPGRPIDLPGAAAGSVSADGQRLDLTLSSQDVERLTGNNEPGYAHLAAQHAPRATEWAERRADEEAASAYSDAESGRHASDRRG